MTTKAKRELNDARYPPLKRKRQAGEREGSSTSGYSPLADVSLGSQSSLGTKKDQEKWCVREVLDGEVYYMPEFVDEVTANEWLSELSKLDTWYHPILKVYGKEVEQSRSIAAYSTNENLAVKYSNHVVTMHYTYPTLLTMIQQRVEDLIGERFNHVMLNRYEDGREYIGKHRDTKENKMIASLSLGAERTFIMTPSKLSLSLGAKSHRWKLANGSLLIMSGNTQDNWKHEIPKEPKVRDERISLTFRQLIGSVQ